MPGFNNTIHSTTIAGQVYTRGVPTTTNNYVYLTMNNFSFVRRVARFDAARRILGK